MQVIIIEATLKCTNKNSAWAVPHGQWITAAHKQRRKFTWWKEAICPCWWATGSLHFCEVFREISETGWVLSTTCNSATDKPVLKTENPTHVQFHYSPSSCLCCQPAIDLPSQDTTPMKNAEYQEIKQYSQYFCSLVTSSTMNFLALVHSYTVKEDYKQS